MAFKEVSDVKFDAMIRNDIRIHPCPICGLSGTIEIRMPQYGSTGARVRCEHCGNETKLFPIHVTIVTEGRLANPTNARSLMNGVRAAVQSWNAGAEKAEKARKGWA